MSLKFIGPKTIPGIPARDLSDEEITAIEVEHPEVEDLELALIGTGLYEKAVRGPGQDKSIQPQYQNKSVR
jgi:hypothetical protein